MIKGNDRVSALEHPLKADDFDSDKENSHVENVYYIDNGAVYVVQEKVSLSEGGYISNWYCFESATGRHISVEERKRMLMHTQYNYDFDSEMVECYVHLNEPNGYETVQCRVLDLNGIEIGSMGLSQNHFKFDYDGAREEIQSDVNAIRESLNTAPEFEIFSQQYLSADYNTKKQLLVTSFRQHYRAVGETGLGELYAFLTQEVYDCLKVDPDFVPLLREIAADPFHRHGNDTADEIFHGMLSNIKT